MAKPITSVTIVGGGSTGWLAAAVLNHRLQWGLGHPEGVRITLIESPEIPIIGVGEATIPPIRTTLKMLDISEAAFITRTNATFKLGVRFDNWSKPVDGRMHSFFHPFSGGVQIGMRNPGAALLAYGVGDIGLDPQFGNIVGHGVAAAEAGKSPVRKNDPPYAGTLGYAYHVDAGLFSVFMRDIAVARGVGHVQDKVIGVERDGRGFIAALQLERGGRHPVELVIDCSGFRGLLINEAMEEPFVSYSDYLPNDRAVAVQAAHHEGETLRAATVTTAMDSGWRWNIPLQTRMGTGYVFSSTFADDATVTDDLLATIADRRKLTEPRALKMRVGRTRRSWVGNCVSMGLASGFIEPLESTGIQFVDYACRHLLLSMPSSDFEQPLIDRFNGSMVNLYESVRDFLGLHFTLGDRDDTPYWRAMRHEVKRSDQSEELLALWRYALPDPSDPRSADIFTHWSVANVLLGKGFYNAAPVGGTEMLPLEMWRRYLTETKVMRGAVLSRLPDQRDTLRAMADAAANGDSAARRPPSRAVPQRGIGLSQTIPVMSEDHWVNVA